MSLTSFVENGPVMNGFQSSFVARNGLVMNGPEKCWFHCSVMIGLKKGCFLWFCGTAVTDGLEKACFQWFVVYGPGKAYF